MDLLKRFLESRLLWIAVVALLCITGVDALQRGLAKDPRFLANPATFDASYPRWGGPQLVRPVSRRLERLGPISLFDPHFHRRIEGALLSLPEIEAVTRVRKLWPRRYAVSVRFRKPVAVVSRDGREIPVTQSGFVLPAEPYSLATPGLFRIDGVSTRAPVPGAAWRDPSLRQGLAVLADLAPYLQNELAPLRISRIDVSGAADWNRGVELVGAQRVRVLWGRPSGTLGENPVSRKLALLDGVLRNVGVARGKVLDVRDEALYVRESGSP